MCIRDSPSLDYFTEDEVQSRETVKIASNIPSEENKKRRDYFEEFFRAQHEEAREESKEEKTDSQ